MTATQTYLLYCIEFGVPVLVIVIAGLVIYSLKQEKNNKYDPYE